MQHVIIIGAGLIGASAAYHLSQQGARVTVIDSGSVAGGASGSSFGWINASYYHDAAHHHLRVAGMAAHRRLSTIFPGLYQWAGCLWHETQGAEQAAFAARLTALGYAVTAMDRTETAALFPALADPTPALFLPDEGVAEPDLLAQALLAASGAEVWTGLPVLSLIQNDHRILGVTTASGRVLADHVILAAGIGSADLLSPLGVPLPMLRRPGAIVITRPVSPILPAILCGPEGELRQRPDGRIILPTSVAHQGDSATDFPDLPGVLAAQAIARIAPRFPSVRLIPERVALAQRPVPGDGLPVLGTPVPGLTVAVMHSGVTLGPLAGQGAAALATGADLSPLWLPYHPDRFR